MTTIQLYKVSIATSSKSGAFVPKKISESRQFFQTINSGLRGDAVPQMPEHELIMPKGGWLEDFILGEFGNPYVSARVMELLVGEWGNDFEYVPLGKLLDVDYYILIVRPAFSSFEGKPCVKNGTLDYSVLMDETVGSKALFRVQGLETALYATRLFGEFIHRNQLTGVYLRDPEALLKDYKLPFGLPIMKNGKKPQLDV